MDQIERLINAAVATSTLASKKVSSTHALISIATSLNAIAIMINEDRNNVRVVNIGLDSE